MPGIFGPITPADDFVVDSFGVRGAAGPVPLSGIVAWATGQRYVAGPPASFVSVAGSSYACTVGHTSSSFAADLAAGFWLIVASAADAQAALAASIGQPDGAAPLDGNRAVPLANLQPRTAQVTRAARPTLVTAGGTFTGFLASVGSPDATDGSWEAIYVEAFAPPGGVLSRLLAAYLQSLGLTVGQATDQITAIWTAASGISP